MEQNDKRQAYQDGYRAAVCEFELYSETEIPIDRIRIESWKRAMSSSLMTVPEDLQPKWLEGYTDATNALTTRAAAEKQQSVSEESRRELTLECISESEAPWMMIAEHLIRRFGSELKVAQELSVHISTVAGWVNGTRPYSKSIYKVAAVLNVDPIDLMKAAKLIKTDNVSTATEIDLITLNEIRASKTPWVDIANNLVALFGSKNAMARKLGLCNQTPKAWIDGQVPNKESIVKIADVLNVTVSDLLIATGSKIKLAAVAAYEVERLTDELEECKGALAEVEELLEQSIGLIHEALGPNWNREAFNIWADTVEGYLMARRGR